MKVKVVVTGSERYPKFFNTREEAVKSVEDDLNTQRASLHSSEEHQSSIHSKLVGDVIECYYVSFWQGNKVGEDSWRYTFSEIDDSEGGVSSK